MPSVSEIIESVNRRTESKADTRIDLRLELLNALTEFCMEKHFWWRKKYVSFATAVGTKDYDLSGDAPDLAEIDEIVPATAISGSTCRLRPFFDAPSIIAAANATANAAPSSYTMVPGQTQQIRLGAPADQVATLAAIYWAIPMRTNDTSDEAIPLVPPFLHWGLAYALERRVYEVLYGQLDPRFAMANKRYDDFIEKASRTPSWYQGEVVEARSFSGGVSAASGFRSVRAR